MSLYPSTLCLNCISLSVIERKTYLNRLEDASTISMVSPLLTHVQRPSSDKLSLSVPSLMNSCSIPPAEFVEYHTLSYNLSLSLSDNRHVDVLLLPPVPSSLQDGRMATMAARLSIKTIFFIRNFTFEILSSQK